MVTKCIPHHGIFGRLPDRFFFGGGGLHATGTVSQLINPNQRLQFIAVISRSGSCEGLGLRRSDEKEGGVMRSAGCISIDAKNIGHVDFGNYGA